MTNIDICTGIRQGCNLSALLFILVTFKIIEKIQSFTGYTDDNFNITSLFCMDDGLNYKKNLFCHNENKF